MFFVCCCYCKYSGEGEKQRRQKSSQEIKTYDIHVATIIKHKANFSQHLFFLFFIFLFYDTKVAENSKNGAGGGGKFIW